MNSIEERLKYLRVDILKLTQVELSKKLGFTSKGHMSLLEKGSRTLSERTILSLKLLYNVNPTWLKTGKGNIFIEESMSNIDILCEKFDLSSDEKFILEKFLTFNKHKRAMLISLAKDMLSDNQLSIDEEMQIAFDKYDVVINNNKSENKKNNAM